MSRILIAGIGPLPAHGRKQLFAPGLRVWTFGETLAQAGHAVRLALGNFAATGKPSIDLFDLVKGEDGEFEPALIQSPIQLNSLSESLAAAAHDFGAECLIATADVMAEAAARADLSIPLWVDYYGSPMAERQQQSVVHRSDGGLAAAWRTIVPALIRADHFSACSNAQRLALLGELAACGRLNQFTSDHDLVSVIPPASPQWGRLSSLPNDEKVFRGRIVPEDAFVVLWTGGFNTWTDVQTLHAGLVQAMDEARELHFVSTGGAIPGHCETVYPEFEKLVSSSPHTERFHLLGWVDLERVHGAWQEADLAVNIDRFSYEGLLGTRTRLLDWMQAGLPIATTTLSELAQTLAERSLVYPFAIGDPTDLARVLLKALHDPVERRTRARNARQLLQTEWTTERLLAPMLQWVANPQHAPDLVNAERRPQNTLATAQSDLLQGSQLRDDYERLLAENARLKSELATLHGSRVIRTFLRLKK